MSVSDEPCILNIDHDKKYVTLCAWCDKDMRVTRKLEAEGYELTHGICPDCYEKVTGKKYCRTKMEGASRRPESYEVKLGYNRKMVVLTPFNSNGRLRTDFRVMDSSPGGGYCVASAIVVVSLNGEVSIQLCGSGDNVELVFGHDVQRGGRQKIKVNPAHIKEPALVIPFYPNLLRLAREFFTFDFPALWEESLGNVQVSPITDLQLSRVKEYLNAMHASGATLSHPYQLGVCAYLVNKSLNSSISSVDQNDPDTFTKVRATTAEKWEKQLMNGANLRTSTDGTAGAEAVYRVNDALSTNRSDMRILSDE